MTTIALVGQGSIARTHAASYAELGLADDIAYVCSPRPGAPLEHAPRARYITRLDAVLEDPAVDVLSICTPTPTHPDLAVAALAAGKHVLLEKPVALDLTGAQRITEAAAASVGTLMVAQVVRFFPGYAALRETVESGLIGTPLAARAKRLSALPDWAPWLAEESRSGGVLVDLAVHDIDQMNLLLGRPVSVHCVGRGVHGPFETTVRYDGGGVGQVLSSWSLPAGVPLTAAVEVLGSEGTAEYTPKTGSATLEDHGARGVPGTDVLRLLTATGRQAVPVAANDPYTAQVAYFLDCVARGVAPDRSPLPAAVLALRVALAARRSARTGRTVPITTASSAP